MEKKKANIDWEEAKMSNNGGTKSTHRRNMKKKKNYRMPVLTSVEDYVLQGRQVGQRCQW